MVNIFISFIFAFIFFFNPLLINGSTKIDPNASLLQTRISNNFARKYCKSIQSGLSKDEAMTSAIIKTEKIVSFSINPQKKWIEEENLADQISLEVVNDCGWLFGLIGKEGVDYFKNYFLEINDKITPDKKLSG